MRGVPGGGVRGWAGRRVVASFVTALVCVALVGLASGCGAATRTQIDWVSFVQVRERQYVAVQPLGAPATSPAVLGRVVTKVKKTVAGHVFDPHYRPRDGDAAFLSVGTQLRAVHGFASWFRLGAVVDGDVTIYQLDRRDGTGAQVFDLDVNAIRSLEVRGASNGMLERTVTDRALVGRLVTAIDDGHVHDTDVLDTEPTCIVALTYADTPSVTLRYWASSGTLFPGFTLDGPLRHDLAGVGCA